MVLNWVSIHTPLLPQNPLNPHGKLSSLKFQREILLFKLNSLNNNTTINSGNESLLMIKLCFTQMCYRFSNWCFEPSFWLVDFLRVPASINLKTRLIDHVLMIFSDSSSLNKPTPLVHGFNKRLRKLLELHLKWTVPLNNKSKNLKSTR